MDDNDGFDRFNFDEEVEFPKFDGSRSPQKWPQKIIDIIDKHYPVEDEMGYGLDSPFFDDMDPYNENPVVIPDNETPLKFGVTTKSEPVQGVPIQFRQSRRLRELYKPIFPQYVIPPPQSAKNASWEDWERRKSEKGSEGNYGDVVVKPGDFGEQGGHRKGFAYIFKGAEWAYFITKFIEDNKGPMKFSLDSISKDTQMQTFLKEKLSKFGWKVDDLFYYNMFGDFKFEIIQPLSEKFGDVKSWALRIASRNGAVSNYALCMLFFKYGLKRSRKKFTSKELAKWAVINGLKKKNKKSSKNSVEIGILKFLKKKTDFLDLEEKVVGGQVVETTISLKNYDSDLQGWKNITALTEN